MDDDRTRFFCQCGRLLNVSTALEEIVCPTCGRRMAAPRGASSSGASGTQLLTQQAGSVIEHYRIEAALGSGGMGSVYRAVDTRTGDPVALKLLHPSLQSREDFVSRFHREAKAASRLEHPNIVRVLDYGVAASGPYLAMELLRGRGLLTAAKEEAADEARIIDWMTQVASGLRAAAARGITHRDIKPNNLLLQDDGVVKIADFGLAKATDVDSQLTVTGEVLGTPHYMSPEQGRGDTVNFSADLYSLGATFYHLLSGKPPFTADTPVAVIMKHIHEPPAPLREIAPRVSPGIEAVIHRTLMKEPVQRYRSYDQLLEDVRLLQNGLSPRHGAPPPARRVRDGRTTYVLPNEAQTELLLRPATGSRRGLAMLLDLALLELLAFAGSKLWSLLFPLAPDSELETLPGAWNSWDGELSSIPTMLGVLLLAIPMLYFIASDGRGGKSFGKSKLNLRVGRSDGENAGAGAALLRLLLLLPGLMLVSPSASHALFSLIDVDWSGTSIARNEQTGLRLRIIGLSYLLALSLLGRLSGVGLALHDALSGTRVWHASKAAQAAARPALRRPPSPTLAFCLSLFPGGGLLYSGQLGLGLLAMVSLPALLPVQPTRVVLSAWLLSAALASHFAHRRVQQARRGESTMAVTSRVVRRKES